MSRRTRGDTKVMREQWRNNKKPLVFKGDEIQLKLGEKYEKKKKY